MSAKNQRLIEPLPATFWRADKVEQRSIASLKHYGHNSRQHSEASLERLASSIRQFGFASPILLDKQSTIICGHGRVRAAERLGMKTVPAITADHLSESQVRALRITDNRIAELSEWDEDALRIEFKALADLDLAGALDFDLTITGFDMPAIDLFIEGDRANGAPVEVVELPTAATPAITSAGDRWLLGPHQVLCADSLRPESYAELFDGDLAGMVFTDPPYNVQVQGHVRTAKGGSHKEFAMASGEMSASEFRAFLIGFLYQVSTNLRLGGIAMVCMDWRHIHVLIEAGIETGFELINLCVWNKTNGGMGSLYRSKHELVCVFKKPGAAHVNNVELGRHGRYRTNVWDYAGVNSFGAGRAADLADHPTVKPTPLVADAIRDVSRRGDIVLDPFGGSGATLLAADKTGRRARLIELEPAYVDVTIRRWQTLTGKAAVHALTGETFDTRASRQTAAASMETGHV